jgi:hypothetical protein
VRAAPRSVGRRLPVRRVIDVIDNKEKLALAEDD